MKKVSVYFLILQNSLIMLFMIFLKSENLIEIILPSVLLLYSTVIFPTTDDFNYEFTFLVIMQIFLILGYTLLTYELVNLFSSMFFYTALINLVNLFKLKLIKKY